MVTTTDQREIDNFAALSDKWWDPRGPMAPLHAFTPVRIDYMLANVERFWPRAARPSANTSHPLAGVRILDIGGEATNPGSKEVNEDVEWKRIFPTLFKIKSLITFMGSYVYNLFS